MNILVIDDDLYFDERLTRKDLIVYGHIYKRAKNNPRGCFEAQTEIAKRMNVRKEIVCRSLKKLVDLGYLEKQEQSKKSGAKFSTCIYRLRNNPKKDVVQNPVDKNVNDLGNELIKKSIGSCVKSQSVIDKKVNRTEKENQKLYNNDNNNCSNPETLTRSNLTRSNIIKEEAQTSTIDPNTHEHVRARDDQQEYPLINNKDIAEKYRRMTLEQIIAEHYKPLNKKKIINMTEEEKNEVDFDFLLDTAYLLPPKPSIWSPNSKKG